MGCHFRFHCTGCSYQAEVSGGPDRGVAASTVTIHCERCRQLYDVVDGTFSGPMEGPKPVKVACPVKRSHPYRVWQHPGDCPACGAGLTRGEIVLIWD